MTASDYIAQLRMGNACALLINSDMAISLVAAQVGYRNLANFNRQFRRTKGHTPQESRGAFKSGHTLNLAT